MKPVLTLSQTERQTHKTAVDLMEISVPCADCGIQLMSFLVPRKTVENDVTSFIVCRCGVCGGRSLRAELKGPFSPGTPNDSMTFDLIEQTDSGDYVFEAKKK